MRRKIKPWGSTGFDPTRARRAMVRSDRLCRAQLSMRARPVHLPPVPNLWISVRAPQGFGHRARAYRIARRRPVFRVRLSTAVPTRRAVKIYHVRWKGARRAASDTQVVCVTPARVPRRLLRRLSAVGSPRANGGGQTLANSLSCVHATRWEGVRWSVASGSLTEVSCNALGGPSG